MAPGPDRAGLSRGNTRVDKTLAELDASEPLLARALCT